MHYGLPEKILNDQGCNFESRLIAELCEICKVKKLHTTPYIPQYNGKCKHFNATLILIIGTPPVEAKTIWQEWLPTLVHAYNCSHSNATGFSPFLRLELGDLVLVRKKAFKGKHKISDRLENTPYHVIEHKGRHQSIKCS